MKALASTLLAVALLAIAVVCRQYLEQTMVRHMLVQIPMLIAAGVAAHRGLAQLAIGRAWARRASPWDENGLSGLLAFLLVSGYWMIPKALDSAITSVAMEQGKMLSLFFIGLMLPASLSRANLIIQLFFLGNFASMMAIVGMLYQDAPKRLCNFYLSDDQVLAGMGLVALAVVLPLLWAMGQARVMRYFRGTAEAASSP